MNLTDYIVPVRHDYKNLLFALGASTRLPPNGYVWVAYSTSPPYLPVAVADTVQSFAHIVGVSPGTIGAEWSRYQRCTLKKSRYHRVKVDDV